ncbi:hypothetical protein GCM10012280_27200 [Wenjunlia tyrosinilytica]|uniref:Uncharacterized protein n=1 Tax=Wenjunlia tyrosinilytica TaxID=1544741 RepID=A0A917ZQ78_9ACTN|nr:hypothetical protein GCM10012280_27200 [Wenjunlia tyrosinilytica]
MDRLTRQEDRLERPAGSRLPEPDARLLGGDPNGGIPSPRGGRPHAGG